MRCPKCSYLSYDDVERCRNCGYDFSLATAVPAEPEPRGPIVEPEGEVRAWQPTERRRSTFETEPEPEGAALDLPLFDPPLVPDPPPVVIPPAGPPLSVRRKVEMSRPAAPASFEWTREVEPQAPDLPLDDPEEPGEPGEAAEPPVVDEPPVLEEGGGDGFGARLRAGAVDAAILIVLDLVVLWLTLRVAGVPADEWRLIPLAPLAGFLFLLDTSYLVTFTAASGQTIGKMLSGVRVAYGDDLGRVPFGHAVLRSVALLVCAAPLGLGLLPLFLDAGRRGAHDRLAGTRVVPSA